MGAGGRLDGDDERGGSGRSAFRQSSSFLSLLQATAIGYIDQLAAEMGRED